MTATQESDVQELAEQREYLEQMAEVYVPAWGDPSIDRRHTLKEVDHLYGTPLVDLHEFNWPHHSRAYAIRVRMEFVERRSFSDSRDGYVAVYRVTLPDYE